MQVIKRTKLSAKYHDNYPKYVIQKDEFNVVISNRCSEVVEFFDYLEIILILNKEILIF